VLTRLHQATVDYMLANSMASNYWGIPRTTHDLDFVVVLAPHQVASFAAAFQSGMFIQEDSVRSALDPPHQINALDEQSARWASILHVKAQLDDLVSGKITPKST